MALARLLRRRRGKAIEAKTPEGVRLYAIGDIHGRADLLRDMHRMISEDLSRLAGAATVVYLGDYIDRGLDSRGVLDMLMDQPIRFPALSPSTFAAITRRCCSAFSTTRRAPPSGLTTAARKR